MNRYKLAVVTSIVAALASPEVFAQSVPKGEPDSKSVVITSDSIQIGWKTVLAAASGIGLLISQGIKSASDVHIKYLENRDKKEEEDKKRESDRASQMIRERDDVIAQLLAKIDEITEERVNFAASFAESAAVLKEVASKLACQVPGK